LNGWKNFAKLKPEFKNSGFIQYVVNQGDIKKSHLKLYLPSLAHFVIREIKDDAFKNTKQ